jgi:hypothetical protein
MVILRVLKTYLHCHFQYNSLCSESLEEVDLDTKKMKKTQDSHSIASKRLHFELLSIKLWLITYLRKSFICAPLAKKKDFAY